MSSQHKTLTRTPTSWHTRPTQAPPRTRKLTALTHSQAHRTRGLQGERSEPAATQSRVPRLRLAWRSLSALVKMPPHYPADRPSQTAS
ncbi:hypothetical protein GCM10010428_46550 [Actinosynnema pretiosum subsp. pretiosum]